MASNKRIDEVELFAMTTQNAYKQLRDNEAHSKLITMHKLKKVAQGRVWTDNDAALRDLVDAIGGLSCVAAIAKQKVKILLDKSLELSLEEISLDKDIRYSLCRDHMLQAACCSRHFIFRVLEGNRR